MNFNFRIISPKIVLPFLVMISFLLISIGCTQDVEYARVSEASLKPGDEIPVPADAVVLMVSGNIDSTNVNDTVEFDMQTLEQIGLVGYDVEDPWLQQTVNYSGVLLSELLEVVGATDNFTEVFAVALDGYAISIPAQEIENWPILIATQSNGAYMTIESSGPTRIIFPYEDHDNITEARNMSVWNLAKLEVR